MDLRAYLIDRIDEFLARSGMSETAMGLAWARDGSAIARLRRGQHDILLGRAQDLLDWMRAQGRRRSRREHQPRIAP